MNNYDEDDDQVAKKIDLPKMNIRQNNLSEELLYKVQVYIFEAFNTLRYEKEVAEYVKKKLDEDQDLNPTTKGAWHCIVGRTFGLSITFETTFLLFLDYPEKFESVLVFRTQ